MRNTEKIWNAEDMRQVMAEARLAYSADALTHWLDEAFAEAIQLQQERLRGEQEEEEE